MREQGEGAGGVEVPGSLSHAPLAAEGEELVGEEKVATLRGEEGRELGVCRAGHLVMISQRCDTDI